MYARKKQQQPKYSDLDTLICSKKKLLSSRRLSCEVHNYAVDVILKNVEGKMLF